MSWVGRSAFYVASSANLCGRACQALINRTFNRALLVPSAVAVTLAGFASPAFADSPASIAIGFNPTSISVNGTTTLTISITNPNVFAFPQLRYTQTLPAGLTVASLILNGCGGNATGTGGSTISVLGFNLNGGPQGGAPAIFLSA
jgi:hypothetical protein